MYTVSLAALRLGSSGWRRPVRLKFRRVVAAAVVSMLSIIGASKPAHALLGSTTTVISSVNPSAFGQSVTFTATVTGLVITPTGNVTFKDGGVSLGTVALNGSGQATLTTSALTAGAHSITVEYAGDLVYNPSNSTVLTQNVSQNATSTALISSVNPSALAQSVTFTATVTGAGGTPTGNVTFKDGTTTIGTGALDGSGVATFSTSILLPGTHSITAVYGGDTNYGSSTSPVVSQVVTVGSTTTAVDSSLNPSTLGQSVTFTATVTGLIITPTGTVTFKDGATTLGTGTLNGAGVATFTTSALGVAVHSITAEYGGDLIYGASTSPVLSQTVNQSSSSTTIGSSLNPSGFGQSVTFTATVVVPTGTATGTVTFKDGVATIGSGNLNGSGQATFSTAALAAGSHSITAEYGGDSNYTASTSPALTQNVNASSSAITLGSSLNPSKLGQSVTFTATVTGTAPTGNVTFRDGSSVLGVVALNGSGVATLTTSALTAGTHSIVASYGGDFVNGASDSAPLSQVVDLLTTAVTVVSSANPSPLGETITFTATVSGSGSTPSGTVTFKDGTTTLGTGALNGSGQAVYATSALTRGSHSITAVYGGDSTFAASTSPVLTQSIGAPVDSVRLRSLQVAVTKLSAQSSGAAISSAIESAIAEAFDDGEQLIRPTGNGVRINFAAEPKPPLSLFAQHAPEIIQYGVSPQQRQAAADAQIAKYGDVTGSVPPAMAPTANTVVAARWPKEWRAWADMRVSGWNTDQSANDIRGGQINALAGLTRRISSNVAAGVLVGLEGLNYSSDSLSGRLIGNGWTAGVYAGWRPTPNIRATLGAAYSGLTYSAQSGTANAVISGARWTFTGGLAGNYKLTSRLAIEPSLRAYALWESERAYTDSLGTSQDARSFLTGRASAGAKLTYRMPDWGSAAIVPYVGIYGDYHFSKDDAVELGPMLLLQGASARLTSGVNVTMSGGTKFALGGELGGLGSSQFKNWSVRGRASIPF